MLGELERSRKVFKGLDTSQKCVHAVLAWKSGMKSVAGMLTWDFNSFFVRYFNNRRLLLRLVICFRLVLIPVNHFCCWHHFDCISSRGQIQGNVKNRELHGTRDQCTLKGRQQI